MFETVFVNVVLAMSINLALCIDDIKQGFKIVFICIIK